MKKITFVLWALASLSACAQNIDYKIVKTYHIASAGGWDYIAINQGRIYVSHGTQVNILNEANGDSLGYIPNTNGVHGIAFDNEVGRGYTSNGKLNSVTVFDLATNKIVTQIATGQNPDAIMYEPYTKTIITCNGRSKNLSVIDPNTSTVINTIAVDGKPETAVSDGKGKLFVNIEDKNEVDEVDLENHSVINHWTLSAESPTGLAYDKAAKRLFAGCDEYLVVLNAENGEVVSKLPIGDGCDGVEFDALNKTIFTSNGQSGTITAIRQNDKDQYTVLGNYASKKSARTIAINSETGTLYLPAADFDVNDMQNGRPKMVAGSFQILVVQKQ